MSQGCYQIREIRELREIREFFSQTGIIRGGGRFFEKSSKFREIVPNFHQKYNVSSDPFTLAYSITPNVTYYHFTLMKFNL